MRDRAACHRALDAVLDAVKTEQRKDLSLAQWQKWVLSMYPSATFSSFNAFIHKRNGAVHCIGSYDDIIETGYRDAKKSKEQQ
jgi:hypothetical protein